LACTSGSPTFYYLCVPVAPGLCRSVVTLTDSLDSDGIFGSSVQNHFHIGPVREWRTTRTLRRRRPRRMRLHLKKKRWPKRLLRRPPARMGGENPAPISPPSFKGGPEEARSGCVGEGSRDWAGRLFWNPPMTRIAGDFVWLRLCSLQLQVDEHGFTSGGGIPPALSPCPPWLMPSSSCSSSLAEKSSRRQMETAR